MNREESRIILANNLRHFRKKSGLTALQLCARLQERLHLDSPYARNTLTEWETGRYEPPLFVIIALSEIFEITVDELVREKQGKE